MKTKAKIITISSGKGGVGKTCTSVNLGILLAQQGYRVCLFDADANLANVNIMLKLAPAFTLEHVLSGQKTVQQITLHKSDMDIIPGASGLTDFISMSSQQQKILMRSMQELKSKYDYLIIDNPAGISKNVLSYINFADYNFVIVTPEPTSLTDAFALVRVTQRQQKQKYFHVIVNNAKNKDEAYRIFKRFSMAVEKHIGCEISFLGQVVADERVAKSVCLQNPVVQQYPNSPAAHDFIKLSIKLASLSNQTFVSKPAISPPKQPEQQQPDFSTNIRTLNKDVPQQVETPSLSAGELKTALINYIQDEKTDSADIKDILQEINRAYTTRFGEHVLELPEILNHSVKTQSISEPVLRNLLMTLHSLYQEQYAPSAELDNFASDVIENNLSQETIELLIKLLQQKKLAHFQQQISFNKQINLQDMPDYIQTVEIKNDQYTVDDIQTMEIKNEHDLLDCIRYAAMVDK